MNPDIDLLLAHQQAGDLEQAEVLCRQMLEYSPTDARVLSILGILLQERGAVEEAVRVFESCLQWAPNCAQAHHHLGLALRALGQPDRAELHYRAALRIEPDRVDALLDLGVLHHEQSRLTAANDCYLKVLEVRPELVEVRFNLAMILRSRGQVRESIAQCRRVLAADPSHHRAHSHLLLSLHYLADTSAEELFGEHRHWAARHTALIQATAHGNDVSDPTRRLRIGYLSSNLRTHSVTYFLEPILAAHHPQEVEIYGYAQSLRPDETTRRLQSLAHHWRWVTDRTDEQLVRQIQQDQIDILVDLNGHTQNNRLLVLAHRPAPIQVTYLGYPDTTGMAQVDYRLTDARADPPGTTEHLHTEALIRLPEGFLCYQPPARSANPVSPPILANGYLTLGSFNALAKIDASVVALWAKILQALPSAHLLLKAAALEDAAVVEHFCRLFAERGIQAERLHLLAATTSMTDHLDLYGAIDIALDPFPYNGTTTTCEALWMGVPVITLAGGTHVSRVGASILGGLGLEELIAGSPQEYVAKAVALAGDIERLNRYRETLRPRLAASRLCDGETFTRNLERIYRTLWERYCHQQARTGIAPVPPLALLDLGAALQAQNRWDEAIECYRQGLGLEPDNTGLLNALGYACKIRGRLTEAIACFDRAVELVPEDPLALWNRAIALLLAGDLERGFAEYEWRFWMPDYPSPAFFAEHWDKLWDGSALQGKSLLVYAEQGFGDAIQFIRYVPQLARQADRVVVACAAALLDLFETVEGVSGVVDRRGPLPEFDLCVASMSLPHLLGTSLENLPARVPYLKAAGSPLPAAHGRFKVGFVWAAGHHHRSAADLESYQLRSCPLEPFVALIDHFPIALYSLQLGAEREQLEPFRHEPHLHDLGERIRNFADTAAFVAQLDLVISIDTAVVHLCGALARPTWILLPFTPDWRWMLERADSPWYPTVRLFRQSEAGEWRGVFARVRRALQEQFGE